MKEPFLTFQKFNDMGLAEAISARLKENGIESLLENNQKFFDPSFAHNSVEADISLKLRPEDFPRADQALADYYQQRVDSVDKDYYLFGFTDQELIEILRKPDEWGHFDYQLTQKILRDRGMEIGPETTRLMKAERIAELAQPKASNTSWIFIGYISAIMGGVFGIVIGATLAYFKKTLPDGQRVYGYREEERRHGKIILGLSLISAVIWWLFRIPFLFILWFHI